MRIFVSITLFIVSSLIMNAQTKIILTNGEKTVKATLADNNATRQLVSELQKGSISIDMSEYGGFEMVGALPWSLPTENRQTTTVPGDIMLYQGNNMVIFYGSNSWSYTPLGKIEGATAASVKDFLGIGSARLTVSADTNSGVKNILNDGQSEENTVYDLTGNIVKEQDLTPGIYIRNGKKFIVR
ncbi:MAG: cyclophilin-like fold protein [Muribaculum sp.]|nr:cyclophilin-like fold protein [Muribaculum sp.]